MSLTSEQLFEKSKQLVPGGVHSPVRSFKGMHTTPRFINKADGAFLTDEEGKNYIDFCMSFGPMILGHRNPIVEEAIKNALTRGWTYGACEKYSLELAEFLINKIDHIDQIRFVNSGTEAVMTAIRIARGVTGKNKIIKFDGCYHGHMDSMLIKAGSGLAGEGTNSSAGVTKEVIANTLIFRLDDLEGIERTLETDKDVAAIFLEPLPANNGLLVQDENFLPRLRKICDKNHVLLVYDEVISGFRVGFGGMGELSPAKPDIVTYGKIIGGGFPVGAIAGKKEIMECLAPIGDVYQAGTLSANPVAMTAGLATLKQLTPEFYQGLAQTTESVVSLLGNFMQKNGYEDYHSTHFASLFWSYPSQQRITRPDQIPTNLNERFFSLFKDLLERGVYLAPNAYEVGFVSGAHQEALPELEQRLQ